MNLNSRYDYGTEYIHSSFNCPKCSKRPLKKWTMIEKTPEVLNRKLSDEVGVMVYEWEEIHRCWFCFTKYIFINGNA